MCRPLLTGRAAELRGIGQVLTKRGRCVPFAERPQRQDENELVKQWTPLVWRFVKYHRGRYPGRTVDEIFSALLLLVFRAVRCFDNRQATFGTYLHNVLSKPIRWACADLPIDAVPIQSTDDNALELPDRCPTPDRIVEENEHERIRQNTIRKAIDQLDSRQRAVIILHFFESQRFCDIGKHIECTGANAHHIKDKALTALRSILTRPESS